MPKAFVEVAKDGLSRHGCPREIVELIIEERKRIIPVTEARLVMTLAVLKSLDDETASVNMVDSDAVMMMHKGRRMVPSYSRSVDKLNPQVLVSLFQ